MAQPAFDATQSFGQEAFTDIIFVQVGGRKIKCHKLVLCHASEPLRALCLASGQSGNVIELRDENYEAIEAMLKYIYTLRYDENLSVAQKRKRTLHIETMAVALRYRIKGLFITAGRGLVASVEAAGTRHDVTWVVELIKVLLKYHAAHPLVARFMDRLAHTHLHRLMEKAEFRDLCSSEHGRPLLGLVLKAIERGIHMSERKLVRCHACQKTWMGENIDACPVCGATCKQARTITPCWVKM
ncbi:hypothetical protein LTR37_007888 [Vermiconidia calcicola]|uniref:Uncharacterized protein n=1 Tax=Vermiconidia calcicola TaxID=1690605 RepID=A0ACC3NCI4_9PEZI|nr:hypothetical protein LTR37_007888 [Vermiconidia calcicola]